MIVSFRFPPRYMPNNHISIDLDTGLTLWRIEPMERRFNLGYGILSLSTARSWWQHSDGITPKKLNFVHDYLSEPNCPFRIYMLSMGGYTIASKPIEDLIWTDTQLFREFLMTLTPSENRAGMNDASEKALQIRKVQMLSRASEPSLQVIRNGLNEEQRLTYARIKSEVIEMELSGKFQPLTDLERERLVLLRMVEISGLLYMLSDPTGIMSAKEAAAYVELSRKMGNEAQRVTENIAEVKTEKKSAFKALEELTNAGFKVEISKKPAPIDVQYTSVLDDGIPDPEKVSKDGENPA